jgi:DGQHR domain-containing protein
MLATRIRQKEGTFYFIAYNAVHLLDKVRFTSRYFFEGEEIAQAKISEHDDVAQFIAGIERSEKGFQRQLNRQKVKQIVNFYETVVAQPMIPGTILIFTDETLRFQRSGDSESVGHLSEPKGKYLVIDGQHRLAGLHFFHAKHPDQIANVEVPCVLFDGRSGDFATEMFVIISTHTASTGRISWTSTRKSPGNARKSFPRRSSTCSMPRTIRRSSTRSTGWRAEQTGKGILQSEVFNELLKVVTAHKRWMESHLG